MRPAVWRCFCSSSLSPGRWRWFWWQRPPAGTSKRTLGLHRSYKVVFRLSSLFALDAFAGGFVVQSMIAWWLHVRYGVDEGMLGTLFFGANLLAGVSALLATRLADRIGLVRTMVYTHITSNILLCLVPLMPNFWLAITVLLLRSSISQMDVPARQSYTMAVVAPDERSAASGITTVARSVGAAVSPLLAGLLMANPLLFSLPFFVAGGLKIAYDVTLYKMFKDFRRVINTVIRSGLSPSTFSGDSPSAIIRLPKVPSCHCSKSGKQAMPASCCRLWTPSKQPVTGAFAGSSNITGPP